MSIRLRILSGTFVFASISSFAATNLIFKGAANQGKSDVAITLVRGDITKQQVDIIVNAANVNLQHGGGVCGAIFDAAGSPLDDYMSNNYARGGQVGGAYTSPAFNLKSQGIQYIIHAVGPDTRVPQQNSNKESLLKAAYTNSLQWAAQCKVQSIAFPSISTAIFGYAIQDAAKIVVPTLINAIQEAQGNFAMREIRLVLFGQTDFDVYANTLNAYQSSANQSKAILLSSNNNKHVIAQPKNKNVT